MKKIIIIFLILTFTNYYKVNNVKEVSYNDEIIIEKIDLRQNIKSYKDSDVNHNIIYLKESNFANNFYILAAHSGNSNIAYFKNLYKLKNGDEIVLNINNNKQLYYVKKIEYINKTGTIILPSNSKNTLYLTTCDKFNKNRQLLIKCVNKT